MKTLTPFLLIGSLLTLLVSSCGEGEVYYAFNEEYAVVNRTNSTIKFFAPDFTLSLAPDDSIRLDEFGKNFLYANEPKGIEVGDSVTLLSDYPIVNGEVITNSGLCWPYNCLNEQTGQYEWMHTYLIDDQWIIDAWAESRSGRCVPGAKSTHYD